MTQISDDKAERFRRSELVGDIRGALAQNENLDQRVAKRSAKADAWAVWFHRKMETSGATDPAQLLPEAFAQLEQLVEDRVAIATKEIKAALREALK